MRPSAVPVLLIAALALLASCSPAPGKTVLRVAKWGALADESEYSQALRKAYRDFEESHPGVELQIETIPDSAEYFRKLLLGHISGSVPDVVTVDASSSYTLMAKGVLLPLDEGALRSAGIKKTDYFENVVSAFSLNGQQYAVPLDFTPMVVYYNKDLFDQRGVDYPADDWTWDEFRETALKLSGGGKFGFKVVSWMPGWVVWLTNNGGGVFRTGTSGAAQVSVADPSNMEAVRFLTNLVLADQAAPSLSHAAASGIDPFANGECAMEVNGHWAMVGYQSAKGIRPDRIGVAPLPVATKGLDSKTVFYAAGLGVGRTTKNKELAIQFVAHMTSFEVQRALNVTGIAVCARKDVAAETARGDAREQKFLEIVPSASPPAGSHMEGYDFVETEGDKMMSAVLNNGVRVEAALNRMAEQIRRYREKD